VVSINPSSLQIIHHICLLNYMGESKSSDFTIDPVPKLAFYKSHAPKPPPAGALCPPDYGVLKHPHSKRFFNLGAF
jgi:hypothetical protein